VWSLLALTAAMTGCAFVHHEKIVLSDRQVNDVPIVDMLVVTTRARSAERRVIFSGERSGQRSLYNLIISIPPDGSREIGHIQWPTGSTGNPHKLFAVVKGAFMGRQDVDRWFVKVAGKKHKLLIYIHGYNTTFAESAYSLAQIAHDSGTDATPVLFSWPSRANPLDYVYDSNSATYSRDDLEFILTRAATDPNVSDITVMAHSLGNWLMMESLRQMSIRHGRILPKISNIIMASADLDIGVFEKQLTQIKGPRPRTTIFAASDDIALGISRQLDGGVDRVGDAIPEPLRYMSVLKRNNIVAINLTKLKSGDQFNHDLFSESPQIIRLIGSRLIEDREISGSDLTLGETIVGGGTQTRASIPR
jgi:esterase/lipase superfamily enzyme